MVEGVELASCFDVPYNDPILARHHDLLARRRKVRAGYTGHAGLLFLPKFLFKRHKYDENGDGGGDGDGGKGSHHNLHLHHISLSLV